MKKQTIILAFAGLAVAFAVGGYAWRASSRAAPQANQALSKPVGSAAVKTEAVKMFFASTWPDLQGHDMKMQGYVGKPLVVNFWATWCVPCVEEMPALDMMARRMPDVQFVGVGVDTYKNITDFVTKIPVSYPLLVAGHRAIATIQQLGNAAGGLPFTVLFDAKGNLVETILGQVKIDDLNNRLSALSKN